MTSSLRFRVATAILIIGSAAQAQVTRIVIDSVVSPAFGGASYGAAGQYETLAGRAFGELDPNDRRNNLITDLQFAPRNSRDRVEYVARFFIVKPIDLSKSSHLMWHDVPNRGGRITIVLAERIFGDIGLSSGWQGDEAGRTVPRPDNEYALVPVAKNADGSPITGPVIGRIVNASGVDSRPLIASQQSSPVQAVDARHANATLTTHASESADGTSPARR